MPLVFDRGPGIERTEGLNPHEPVAETIDGDVTVSAIGFGLVIEPRKLSVAATAIMIVVDDYVFAVPSVLASRY